MLDNNFKIKLTMLSDWQIGTGAGIPGGIDELISKDVDGFPQVPAKTLVGIWRDAMERLCDGLGGNWSNWVEVIFGNQPNEKGADPTKPPVSAIISLQPARISENLRAKIGDDKRLKQSLTFTKVGVKINPDSGTSETEALRFEEMGRIGTVLEADVELEKTNEIIGALLILSAKLVERIGGKRRRGSGKCKLEIDGITKEDITKAVTTISKNQPTTDKKIQIKQIEFTKNPSDWQTCEYTLTLETPVSIVTAVLGNVSETLDFIPGTYLINHFVKQFGRDIFTAIQNNNFQISPATICIDGNRSFPVPKVFAQEKMNKDNVYNRLLEPLEGKEQTKPIREGYVSDLTSSTITHATTPETILMHNAVDDEVQRPTTDVVGVYSREAIKAGTVLKGEIRFRNLQFDYKKLNSKDDKDDKVKKVRIGTSKKDSGLAEIKFEKIKPFTSQSVKNSEKTKLIVYLASDVMLRNGNLRQTNLVGDLAKAIGLDEKTKADFQQIQVRRIESWQTSWGFPRPTLTLMQAGSVVVFETDRTIDFAKIEAEGIGERRGEGYGQIIFNPQVLDENISNWETIKQKDFKERNKCQKKVQKSDEEIQKEIDKKFVEEVRKDTSLNTFAKLIEETAWREEIKLAVSKIAADEKLRKDIFGFEIERDKNGKVTKSTPAMSQIGGLRSAVMRLQKIEDKQLVLGWLGHLKDTNNRIEKWDKRKNMTNAKELVDNKLVPLFSTLEKVWLILCETKIDDVNVWKSPKTLVQTKEQLQKKLWAEAVKSLFYACQHAHKRDTEDK
jgi:CRISPR-associated protein Csx10